MKTVNSMRVHIGLFGRTNVGKSSFLNMVTAQEISITSSVPGTTTDVVSKPMELLPLGPVLFFDTAGLDDRSELAQKRMAETEKIFARIDLAVVVTDSLDLGTHETELIDRFTQKKTPFILVVNKCDLFSPEDPRIAALREKYRYVILTSSIEGADRERYVSEFKKAVIELCPDGILNNPPLIGDLVPEGSTVILLVPIDTQAPKGRLILPQVQTIRDGLDFNLNILVTNQKGYLAALENLKTPPALVVCDSQITEFMIKNTPKEIKCTTFSILQARIKGELSIFVRGARLLGALEDGDKILIAEACTHHALKEDIGRVKIPHWISEYTDKNISIEVCSGHDYPKNLSEYKLVIHCGGCMLNRREMLTRIEIASAAAVGITNYGICISFLKGVLPRVLEPFE